MCVEAGMVAGQSQAIDGAFVEANASLDTLERKAVLQWNLLQGESQQTASTEKEDQSSSFTFVERITKPKRPARNNATYQSKTDPEARLAQKPGKPFRLYYLSTISVDTYHHVITHIQADCADERDSHHLLAIVETIGKGLKHHNLPLKNILADGGFGSGINYAMLESYGITAYIPLQGSYHRVREGFFYDAHQDVYLCSQGKQLVNRGIRFEKKGFANYHYRTSYQDCRNCPIKQACVGKHNRQSIAVTAYRNHYQRMQERLESRRGKYMKKRRMATVEPVFGTLLNFYGMRRVNAKGKLAAHKMMLIAATVYNLQKLLKRWFSPKTEAQTEQLIVPQAFCFFSICVVPQPRTFSLLSRTRRIYL
jgi:hypothetical protein